MEQNNLLTKNSSSKRNSTTNCTASNLQTKSFKLNKNHNADKFNDICLMAISLKANYKNAVKLVKL